MNIVIASFAIVILAIAILFSQRYEFVGNEQHLYRLDNFTGKIEKIEGSYIIKMNKKLNIKKLETNKKWENFENNEILATLNTEYINEILFIKLLIKPKIKNFKPKPLKLVFLDKNGFIIKAVTVDKFFKKEKHIEYYSSLPMEIPFYTVISSWSIVN